MQDISRELWSIRWHRYTTRPLILAAAVFLFVLTVPVIDPGLPPLARDTVSAADVGIWLLFAVDYAVRLFLAPARARFVRSHLPDLAMVVLPALRPLRILRLLSLGNLLARRSARSLIADAGIAVAATAGLVTYLGAVAVLDAERSHPHANITTFGDALWWACTTITTVGYGDRYPVTVLGRSLAVVLMLVGIALLGVLTASIAAWFVQQAQQAAAERAAADVQRLAIAEAAGRRRLDVELAEVLDSLTALRERIEVLQIRAATTP